MLEIRQLHAGYGSVEILRGIDLDVGKGEIVAVLGSNGVTRSAERNGEFRQGDSIVTGSNSLAQLRMSDGGAVSVRADTQLKLEDGDG